MTKIKIIFFFFILLLNNISFAKEPSKLISEIVNEASVILSSSDPVEAKIIRLNKNIRVLDALPYLEFLHLMRDSKVIFTDSGGIQEESTILKVPCYTLRNNTERPITISQGTNHLVGNKKNEILKSFKENQFIINPNYKIPYGWDGKASNRILDILDKLF